MKRKIICETDTSKIEMRDDLSGAVSLLRAMFGLPPGWTGSEAADDSNTDDGYPLFPGRCFRDYEYEAKLDQELEEIGRNTKVVEDEFDDDGRPRVKILYVDPIPMDWSYKFLHLMDIYCENVRGEERKSASERRFLYTSAAGKGKYSKPPRLIFVLQDKDYWPGTESDPDAMKRRELKEKAVTECGLRPYGGTGRPDFKELFMPMYEKQIHDCFNHYFNPDLPGAKFLLENFPEPERNIWKLHIERYKRPQQQQKSSPPSSVTTKAIVAKLEANVTRLEQEIKKLQKKLEV